MGFMKTVEKNALTRIYSKDLTVPFLFTTLISGKMLKTELTNT
jgi:hypothetical protein